jgi:hypothetical protein
MNVWKQLALVATAVLSLSSGYPAADASSATPPAPVAGAQPHMAAALGALNTAVAELKLAEHDQGGWRAAAKSTPGVPSPRPRGASRSRTSIDAGNREASCPRAWTTAAAQPVACTSSPIDVRVTRRPPFREGVASRQRTFVEPASLHRRRS